MGALFAVPTAPRSANKTRLAAEQALPLLPHFRAIAQRISGRFLYPQRVASREDTAEINLGYHSVRTRPYAFSDCGYPVAIYLPENTAEVSILVHALSAMRADLDEAQVKVAVAGGCHGTQCMPDGAVVIDLQLLKSIYVNADLSALESSASSVTCGGGCRAAEVDQALAKYGSQFKKGFATGTNGDTGVAGLTLGGGVGFLGRSVGFACDSLLRAVVVLASGEVVECTDTNEYADLMRVLRGGGGNFGIVTEMEFALHDVSSCFGGLAMHATPTMKQYQATLASWDRIVSAMPNHCQSVCVCPTRALVTITVGAAIGPEVRGKEAGDIALFKQLRTIKGPLLHVMADFKELDYHKQLQHLLDRFYVRSNQSTVGFCVPRLDRAIIGALAHFTHMDVPPYTGAFLLFPLGGKYAAGVEGRASVLGHRDAAYWLICEGVWATEAQKPSTIAWTRRVMAKVRELGASSTAHTSDLMGSEATTYAGEKRLAMRQMKAKYDGTNFFRGNLNVLPEGA